jgi:hypothetical protein
MFQLNLKEVLCDNLDSIHLVPDMVYCRAVGNTVRNVAFHKRYIILFILEPVSEHGYFVAS